MHRYIHVSTLSIYVSCNAHLNIHVLYMEFAQNKCNKLLLLLLLCTWMCTFIKCNFAPAIICKFMLIRARWIASQPRHSRTFPVSFLWVWLVVWLGTFLNPPKIHLCTFGKRALIFKMHHAFSLIFHIQHLWPVLLCQVLIFPPFDEVKVPVSNGADFFLKRCHLEDFDGFGVVRVNQSSRKDTYSVKNVYITVMIAHIGFPPS